MAEENAEVGVTATSDDSILAEYTGFTPEETAAMSEAYEAYKLSPKVLEPVEREKTLVSEIYESDPARLPSGTQKLPTRADAEDLKQEMREYLVEAHNVPQLADVTDKELNDTIRGALIYDQSSKEIDPTGLYEEPQTFTEATGRILKSRKLIRLESDGRDFKETRLEAVRERTRRLDELLKKGTVESLSEVADEVWNPNEPISKEHAVRSGMNEKYRGFLGSLMEAKGLFGRAEGDEDDSFFIPYILKAPFTDAPEITERIGEFIGVGNAFSPLFVEDKDMEAYRQTVKMVNPTENFSRLVDRYESAKEYGMDDSQMKDELYDDFYRLAAVQSYNDLPFGTQISKPSIENFKMEVKQNPEFFAQLIPSRLKEAIDLAQSGGSDKEIQKRLDKTPFLYLPASVWAGTMPSPDRFIDVLFDDIRSVVAAKGDAGRKARRLMKNIEQTMLVEERVGDEILVVESLFGKMLRLTGVVTEPFMEARLPGDIPITPASRDFYYELGIRDKDSSVFARILANIAEANIGPSTHFTNEAIARDYTRDDWEYSAFSLGGNILEIALPYERMAAAPIIKPTRAVYRGSRVARTFDLKGGWASPDKWKVFFAGATPNLYNYVENVASNVDFSVDLIRRLTDGEVTTSSIQALLDADDALVSAQIEGQPAPTDELGRQPGRLGYVARRVAEQLIEKMNDGANFFEATEQVKKSYKPDRYETIHHATSLMFERLAHTEEGKRLFKRTADGKGVLPFEIEQQLNRVIEAAGYDYYEVKRKAQAASEEHGTAYMRNLRSAYFLGDSETIELRNTPQYKKARSKLEEYERDGKISANQKVVLLALMENRSIHATVSDVYPSIKKPEDFFGKFKITQKKIKKPDGTELDGGIEFRVDKGVMSITEDGLNNIIDIFRNGELMKLLENNAEPMIDLMGRDWTSKFINGFETEQNINPNAKIKNKLKDRGEKQVEYILRSLIDGQGNLGARTNEASQLFENLQALYARIRGDSANFIPTDIRGRLDSVLSPDRWFRNDLVDINMRARRRTDQKVFRSDDRVEKFQKELRRKAGQKRYFDIDTDKEYVRQGLGLVESVPEMEAIDLMSRGLGYVMAEVFKLQESRALVGGATFVPLGLASAVSPAKAKSVRARVNARMAKTLGIESHSKINKKTFLDADKIEEMADVEKKHLTLSLGQQSRLRMLIARIIDEPYVAKKLPASISKFDADLSAVKFEDYNLLIEVMLDLEAGAVARTSVYSEKIPKSLGYAILNSMKGFSSNVIRKSGLGEVTSKLDNWFNVKRPMDDSVKPELKNIIRARLKDLQNVPSEVIEAARLARSDKPDASIEYMFDKLRDFVVRKFSDEQIDLIMGVGDEKGILSVIKELTEAEKDRIKIEAAKAFDDGKIPELTQEKRQLIEGTDTIVDPEKAEAGLDDRYAFKIPPGMSRLQFLTRKKTGEMLFKAAKGLSSFKQYDELVIEAFARLDTYSSKNGMTPQMISKLSDSDRVALMDALYIIQKRIETNQTSIQQAADVVLDCMGGKQFGLRDTVEGLPEKAKYLKAFYKGEGKNGWTILYDKLVDESARTDLGKRAVSEFAPAQAFLEMITRMMVQQKLENLFDDLVRHGMPTALTNYSMPDSKISPTGAKYSIDTRYAFYDRVKGHIRQIYDKSGDIITYERSIGPDGQKEVTRVSGPRPIKNVEGIDYRFAAFEQDPTYRSSVDYNDLEAIRAAEEILVKFGKRSRYEGDDNFVTFTFPSGEEVFVPQAMKDEIDQAVQRSGTIGSAFRGEAARTLRMDTVDAPYAPDIPQEIGFGELAEDRIANGIRNLIRLFPVTTSLVKQGITTGFVVPMVPYYVANFIGGAFQLLTAVGPVEGARVLARNPKFVKSVVTRMYGRKRFRPGANEILITKTGQIYTTETFTDVALMYGLDSSFIQAETQKSMAEDIERYLRNDQRKYSYKKIGDYASAWHEHFRDVATAIDNFYRVSIFASEVMDGVSPGRAASIARKAAFDYGALTEFEKNVMRNVIMFYSYMRKNMDLFYDTLMTAPDRVVNQLRLTNGLHQANVQTDPQLGMQEYEQERIKIFFTAATKNKMSNEVKMYALPPTPIMDGVNPILDIIKSLQGDDEAQRMLGTKLVPWLQAPLVSMFDMDLFYGMQIDKFNRVPPYLVEIDTASGGFLRHMLDFQPNTSDKQQYRSVEGDDDRPIMIAKNGMAWWTLKNLVQIPPFGRYMTLFEALDRANLGVVEGSVDMAREAGRYLEENDYMDIAIEDYTPADTQSPRVGYTTFDEMLRFFGITVFISDTQAEAASKVYQKYKKGEWKRKLPRYTQFDEASQAEKKRIYKQKD